MEKEKMYAFRIWIDGEQPRYVVAEHDDVELLELGNGETTEYVCEVMLGCHLGDCPYYIEGEEEVSYGDYIMESGEIIGDESHTGQGKSMGTLDITRTDSLMKKMGLLPFREWDFSLWVGSYWNGSNWRVVVVERF